MGAPSFAPREGWGTDEFQRPRRWVPHPSLLAKGGGRMSFGGRDVDYPPPNLASQ